MEFIQDCNNWVAIFEPIEMTLLAAKAVNGWKVLANGVWNKLSLMSNFDLKVAPATWFPTSAIVGREVARRFKRGLRLKKEVTTRKSSSNIQSLFNLGGLKTRKINDLYVDVECYMISCSEALSIQIFTLSSFCFLKGFRRDTLGLTFLSFNSFFIGLTLKMPALKFSLSD